MPNSKTIKAAIANIYAPGESPETVELGGGFSAVIGTPYEGDGGAPWDKEDGHGPVSGWEPRAKRPHELVLNDDGHSKRFYDFAEAVRIAKRDGWDTAPYGQGTKGERAHRAAMADYNRLRRWCNNDWVYIGVTVTVLYRGSEIADDSLWGIESDGDYWRDVAVEMIEGAIKAHRKETRERNHWAARGVITAHP